MWSLFCRALAPRETEVPRCSGDKKVTGLTWSSRFHGTRAGAYKAQDLVGFVFLMTIFNHKCLDQRTMLSLSICGKYTKNRSSESVI